MKTDEFGYRVVVQTRAWVLTVRSRLLSNNRVRYLFIFEAFRTRVVGLFALAPVRRTPSHATFAIIVLTFAYCRSGTRCRLGSRGPGDGEVGGGREGGGTAKDVAGGRRGRSGRRGAAEVVAAEQVDRRSGPYCCQPGTRSYADRISHAEGEGRRGGRIAAAETLEERRVPDIAARIRTRQRQRIALGRRRVEVASSMVGCRAGRRVAMEVRGERGRGRMVVGHL